MRVFWLTHEGAGRLEAGEMPDPQPGPGEAVVRMRAASLNFLDTAVVTGAYPGASFPLIPIADGAGEVVALGAEVDTVAVGDRVVVHPKAAWIAGAGTPANTGPMRGVSLPGALRELASVRAETLVRAPEHLSFEQAATLPIAATTAWNALDRARIGPGHTVVALGTGGVSLFVVQLAKARGARVVVTSSSDEKLARAKALGADAGVNYATTPDWERGVLEQTGGRGAELVVEGGGAGTFPHSIAAVRHGGMVFSIGFLAGTRFTLDLLPVIRDEIRIVGSNTGPVAMLADAVAAVAAHRIEPVVDERIALDALAGDYLATLARGAGFGKRVVRLWDRGGETA